MNFYLGRTEDGSLRVFERKPNFVAFDEPFSEVRLVVGLSLPETEAEAEAMWKTGSPVWYN